MTREDAITLLDYHYWARDRMLDAVDVLTPGAVHEGSGEQLQLGARDGRAHLWRRMELVLAVGGNSPTGFPDAAAFPDVATIRAAWKSQEQKVRLLVDSLASADQLDRVLRYRTFDGQEMESVFSHMLQHVVNHATYHRGQVTTMLSQLGAPAPKPQDLIRFFRERANDERFTELLTYETHSRSEAAE